MIRRILLGVVLFFVAWLGVTAVVGILGSSNLVWGEDNQYGRVDIPGTKVLHLPARTVDVSVAIGLPGRGNETPDLPLPRSLRLSVVPVGDTGQPTITRDVGSSSNANENGVDTQRRVWKVDVPADGDYRVTTRGRFLGIGFNPQLWFGHGPPIPGTLVPIIAVVIVLLAALIWLVVLPRVRGKPRPSIIARPEPAAGSADGGTAAALEELADLHRRGELSDSEFSAAKARVLER